MYKPLIIGFDISTYCENHKLSVDCIDMKNAIETSPQQKIDTCCLTEVSFQDNLKKFIKDMNNRRNIVFLVIPDSRFENVPAVYVDFFRLLCSESQLITVSERKEVSFDVFISDQASFSSNAKYKVLINRDHNPFYASYLYANNFDDCRQIIYDAEKGIPVTEVFEKINPEYQNISNPIICLVGPSGSGKTTLANYLTEHYDIQKTVSFTTRDIREGEINGIHYNFVSTEEFLDKIISKDIIEYSVYSDKYYGTSASALETLTGPCVLVVDIVGVEKLSVLFPHRLVSFFILRKEDDIISSILQRKTSEEERRKRIANLKRDYLSKDKCMYEIKNTDISTAVHDIARICHIKHK